jgi:hypothetical protein
MAGNRSRAFRTHWLVVVPPPGSIKSLSRHAPDLQIKTGMRSFPTAWNAALSPATSAQEAEQFGLRNECLCYLTHCARP